MIYRKYLIVVGAMATVAFAQRGDSTRRATMMGSSGDSGKCTIEVVVDGVAEVEVAGDMGRLRTLQGQAAEWRRFQCSSALPRNPVDFRFRGVDGRGRVELIRDPGNSRGVAVVRIEDSKGGREGYTFDLEWRGSSGFNGGGFGGRDQYDRGRDDRAAIITCNSDDMRRHYCDIDTRGARVRLLRQRSDADCRQGRTWDYDRRGIWVDRGCRADFEVRR